MDNEWITEKEVRSWCTSSLCLANFLVSACISTVVILHVLMNGFSSLRTDLVLLMCYGSSDLLDPRFGCNRFNCFVRKLFHVKRHVMPTLVLLCYL